MPTDVLRYRSAVAVAARRGDTAALLAARRDLAAAKLEQYIERIFSDAPPLTPEQRDHISALVRAGGDVA